VVIASQLLLVSTLSYTALSMSGADAEVVGARCETAGNNDGGGGGIRTACVQEAVQLTAFRRMSLVLMSGRWRSRMPSRQTAGVWFALPIVS